MASDGVRVHMTGNECSAVAEFFVRPARQANAPSGLCYLGRLMGLGQTELVGLGRDHLYPNYRQPPIVFVRGQGTELWDADGKR